MKPLPSLEQLWQEANFQPNPEQERAIRHTDGPLYLPAGPGSGKTRVLLWRTVNLIVFQDTSPEDIFLSTFTEKAALQLREGLRYLLGMVTNHTGQTYDLGRMYVGTIHSLCQRILSDRRFVKQRDRHPQIRLLDELSQYFYLMNVVHWRRFISALDTLPENAASYITKTFGTESVSRHRAVQDSLSFFSRLTEEDLSTDWMIQHAEDEEFSQYKRMIQMVKLYEGYQTMLQDGPILMTDFALLQKRALNVLESDPQSGSVFRHVIVDEYQDTNTIQEKLLFRLAQGHKNIAVVGDDDQAMYRFRGATVENFVQFPQRCEVALGQTPTRIPLVRNYRSRSSIVDFYNRFMSQCEWREDYKEYRVSKQIEAERQDTLPAVFASKPGKPEEVYAEIARAVLALLNQGVVQDANQIAFLFPSLKSPQVEKARNALESLGLRVYAPRASRFLEVDEAQDIFGVYVHIFGKPTRGDYPGQDYSDFHRWLDTIEQRGAELIKEDVLLGQFVKRCRADLNMAANDYNVLKRVADKRGWDITTTVYRPDVMRRDFYSAHGLSERAKRAWSNKSFDNAIRRRNERGEAPFTLDYAFKRVTSIDWDVLDLFYRLCAFEHFRRLFNLAEQGQDEGPICNLGLITQYLARFMDEYTALIPAKRLNDGSFSRLFFASYLYALFRRGESEYEDADDPFPRGRIPFLTIHQSKGLEFPAVVLGNPRKDAKLQKVEEFIQPVLQREGEPLNRMAEFDVMRLLYVALSRAKNLLIIPHLKGQGQQIHSAFKVMLGDNFPRLHQLDVTQVPRADYEDKSISKSYSFTSDFLTYEKCPRYYMIFRRYGFVAARSQTMFFGSLVHRTLEDLHHHLISLREGR